MIQRPHLIDSPIPLILLSTMFKLKLRISKILLLITTIFRVFDYILLKMTKLIPYNKIDFVTDDKLTNVQIVKATLAGFMRFLTIGITLLILSIIISKNGKLHRLNFIFSIIQREIQINNFNYIVNKY